MLAAVTQVSSLNSLRISAAALSAAVKLSDMARLGDRLPGDILVATHVCTDAPVIPHEPVPFMGSPIGIAVMNEQVVDRRMEGILSIDTTKGNRVINRRGFALSPTIKGSGAYSSIGRSAVVE